MAGLSRSKEPTVLTDRPASTPDPIEISDLLRELRAVTHWADTIISRHLAGLPLTIPMLDMGIKRVRAAQVVIAAADAVSGEPSNGS
jgi:hypothetical protein